MVQAAPSRLTFDDFLALYPEDGDRYELRNGAIYPMRPIGPHEEVIGFTRRKLGIRLDILENADGCFKLNTTVISG